ncbi:MAG: FeoB-associated Cys-rich membrane protein [Acidobacteria bacterium]|nr:FeoB-associated Cys-rich membrane protein [Acidobacteriota bacterium]MCG3194030.1 hypothetical protein [Thermoanaerobaculia bacterium]
MDTLITLSIVACAGLWGVWRLVSRYGRKRSASCGSGCAGCPSSTRQSRPETAARGDLPVVTSNRSEFGGGTPLPARTAGCR